MQAYHNILCQAKITISYMHLHICGSDKLTMPYTILDKNQGSRDAAVLLGRQNCFATCAAPRINHYDKTHNQLHFMNTMLGSNVAKAIALPSREFLPSSCLP